MKRIAIVAAPILIYLVALFAPALTTPTAEAQSVLRVAKGLQSNNVAVLINRAVVLDSAVRFLEVSVANPEIADVQPLSDRSIYIFGRNRGTTTMTLLGENGRLITNVTVKVEADHSELKLRLKQLLPNEPVEVRTARGGLILSGVISGKAKIDRAMSLARAYAGDAVINMMSVGGTQQVMLKVRVAEMSRGNGKNIGVSLGLLGSTQRTAPRVTTGSTRVDTFPTPTQGSTGLGGVLDVVIPTAAAFAGGFGAAFTLADGFLVDVQLDALESKGFVKLLAEPNLVALSGRRSNFLAGGEVPIPVRGDDGEITIAFRPVGVELNFVPQVLDDDLINLNVSAVVSDVDPALSASTADIEVPGFSVRRATTTVELRDGQAFAIAGLLREDFADTVSQVPWLGDLPVLGALFRSADFQRSQSELVIIVSAHLVVAADDIDQLALPTDRIKIPNESALFLLGQTFEGEGPATADFTGVGLDGDFGYVVE
ncbi:MAG: type II and III secretion system protein family protein [Pseudomonadota bacterium]